MFRPRLYRRGNTTLEMGFTVQGHTTVDIRAKEATKQIFLTQKAFCSIQSPRAAASYICQGLQGWRGERMSSRLGRSRASRGPLYPEIHHQGQNLSTKNDHPGTCCFAKAPWPLHLLTGESHWQSRVSGEEKQTWVTGEPSRGFERLPPPPHFEFPPLLGSACLSS